MKDFTRGGQTTLHNIRMVLQIVHKLFLIYLVAWVLYTGYWWYGGLERVRYPLTVFGYFIGANYRVALGHVSDPMTFEEPNHHLDDVLPQVVIDSPVIRFTLAQLKDFALDGLFWGIATSFGITMLCGQFLYGIGRAQRASRFVRGIRLVEKEDLKNQIQKDNKASDIQLAGIPLIKDSEVAHFLLTGSPGTGKTVCLQELLDQIRRKGQRAIIYDKTGAYVKYYYRPDKDIILNPLDARCPAWHVWSECQQQSDYDTLATSLIPQAPGGVDPFWVNSARTLFAATAYQLQDRQEKSNTQMLHYLSSGEFDELAALLAGTEAEILTSEKAAKMVLSVKSVLVTHLRSLRYLKEEGQPFSIREWINKESDDSWLFVSSRADMHESLKPLISAWLNTAGNALMSLGQSRERRIWMCLDELPSLHRLPYLSALMAESRQFGGCLIAAIQSMAQLRDIYGHDAAEALSGLCNTRLFFRTPEERTATWVAKSLGEGEWDEPREGFSYGANTIRDGVSLNRQKIMRPVVTESEIMNLANLEAYLRLPGEWPVTKVKFDYQTRSENAPSFIAYQRTPISLNQQSQTIKKSGALTLASGSQALTAEDLKSLTEFFSE